MPTSRTTFGITPVDRLRPWAPPLSLPLPERCGVWLALLLSIAVVSSSLPAAAITGISMQEIKDLRYEPHVHKKNHLLDLYLPTSAQKPYPLVIWIPGGAWASLINDKSNAPIAKLVQSGWAVASINYTLAEDAPFPAQLNDCKAALNWLAEHASQYGFDKDRFALLGASAGGHLAALVETNLDENSPIKPRAVCLWSAITDIPALPEQCVDKLAKTVLNPTGKKGPVALLLGGPLNKRLETAQAASPIYSIKGTEAPFLIVHGLDDSTVPPAQSKEFAAALKKKGVSAKLLLYKHAGHDIKEYPRAYQATVDFLQEQLK
jgi:acetyl esterase/lipase